jgi:hypothetical protein
MGTRPSFKPLPRNASFRGWHDAGGSYDGACFASVGGQFCEVPRLNHSDLPCVEVHVDGTIDADQLLAACEYLKAFVSQGLSGVREAAHRDKKQKFTALLHHGWRDVGPPCG